MHPEFQQVILWVLIFGGFLFCFVVGGKGQHSSNALQVTIFRCKSGSGLCVSLLAEFILCDSSLCGQVNFLPIPEQIPVCPLKLLLQICCEWSCQQVGLCKLRLVLQQPRVLGVDCLQHSSLAILNSLFFFPFLLGINISMTRVWGRASVFLQELAGAEEQCKDSRDILSYHGYPHRFGAILHDVPAWGDWGE